MKKLALATLVSSTLMAAPLAVMADPGQFFVTPFVGIQHFDHDIENSRVWGLGGEYQFTNHWGTELDYTRAFGDLSSLSTREQVKYERVSLDGIYYIDVANEAPSVSPYLKLGVGHNHYDYKISDNNDQGTDIDAGIGLRFKVADNLSVRAEVKALHELDDSRTNTLATLGIGYAFGGASKPAPTPAPAPKVVAPAPAPAPVDSDGDGVTDDKDKCPNTPRGLEVDADGCEYHLTKTEEIRIDVKFDTNKADISDEYVGEVERVSKFMHKYASAKAEIAGHTDSTASDAYNLKLSQRRADAVKAMLVTRFGIDASRLTAVGYGEAKPIASNNTAEGRAQNRRVVAVMQAETTETVKKK